MDSVTKSTALPGNTPVEIAERAQEAVREPKLQTLRSLQHRDFRFLWFGSFFLTATMWLQQLTVGWMVYDMTNSSVLLGAVSAMRAVPSLLCAPIAGALTDRVDRRKLMMTTQAVMLVNVIIIAVLSGTGIVQVWHVFVFSLVAGIAWTFNNPSRQSLVPTLVPKEDLLNAYSLNAAAFQTSAVIGPALGGFMIAWFGVTGNFLLQAATVVGVIAMVNMMRIPERAGPPKSVSIRMDIAEGMNYVRRDHVVLGLLLVGTIPAFLSQPVRFLMPIFAKDILDVGSQGLGFLMASSGVGALTAAFFLASAVNIKFKGKLMFAALTTTGLALIAFSQSHWFAFSMVVQLFMGVGEITYFSANNAVLQTIIPDNMRGRVTSLQMLNQGLAPLGTMVAGTLTAVIGAPTVVTLMGCCVLAFAATAAIKFPVIRRMQ